MRRIGLLVSCWLITSLAIAQELQVNGIVLGMAKTKGIKLSKKYELVGALGHSEVKLIDGSKVVKTVSTDVEGHFSLAAPTGKLYLLLVEKEGYLSTGILVDTRPENFPAEGTMQLNHMEAVLVKAKRKEPQMIGRMFYDQTKKQIRIIPNPDLTKGLSASRTLVLLRDAINDGYFRLVKKNSNEAEEAPKKIRYRWTKKVNDEGGTDSVFSRYNPIMDISSKVDVDNINESDDIRKARTALDALWKYAETAEDSLILRQQEALLRAAEEELQRKEKLLILKDQQLDAEYAKNIWLLIALVLLLAIVGGGVKYYLDRRKTFIKLRSYNKKIEESIEVAGRIQRSVFDRNAELGTLFSDHLVFNKPRDVVSGDFYWLAEVDGKTMLAVADCTGHGVPGCLLSLLGNQLLHEIVLEKKITAPDQVLSTLHERLVKHLQQDKHFSADGGMDIALCEIDTKAKSIRFSGAMNGLYIIQGDELHSYRGDFIPVGGLGLRRKKAIDRSYQVETIKYAEGDSIFMLSDGIIDQFGGPENKKYGLDRFELILKSNKDKPFADQLATLENDITQWMGSTAQLDDIMVVGVKL